MSSGLSDEEEYRRGVEEQRRDARSLNLMRLRAVAFFFGFLPGILILVALDIHGGARAVVIGFSCAFVSLALFEVARRRWVSRRHG